MLSDVSEMLRYFLEADKFTEILRKKTNNCSCCIICIGKKMRRSYPRRTPSPRVKETAWRRFAKPAQSRDPRTVARAHLLAYA